MPEAPPIKYVGHLPDLIRPGDYDSIRDRKLVRIQIQIDGGAIKILGDSPYGPLLEELLKQLGPEAIEAMLCG